MVLCHFAFAVPLIAIVSTIPLVGTLAVVYVDVRGMSTIHPNVLVDSSRLGCFLLRSQALLENVLAQMDEVPPSRKEVPTSSVGDSTEDASVLTGDVSVQSEAAFAFV